MMRVFTIALALLALPTLVAAQDAAAPADDAPTPTVQVEPATSTVGGELQVPDIGGHDLPADDAAVQVQEVTTDEAAMEQDVGSRSWWYLVGAIVVAGIVLAVIL